MDKTGARWSFRDIFLSLGIAADPAILAISFLGLSAGSLAYGFFYFLGNATGESTALSIFAILGGIVFIVLWILTSGILARMVVVRLLEGRQPSAGEVQEYLAHRAGTLLLIPAAFAVIVLVALGGLGVLEILGRIPGLGPIIFGAAFSLAFLLSLVAILAFVLHTFGGLLYPTILATRRGGLLDVVGEILDLARQKGPLLVVYSLVIVAAGALSALFIGGVASAALALATSSAQGIMGEGFDDLMAGLPSMFRPFLEMFSAALGPLPVGVDVAWHYDLGGFLVGLSLLTIFAACAAYPFALINSAGTIAYFILTPEPLPDKVPGPGAVEPEEASPEPPSADGPDLFTDDDEPF